MQVELDEATERLLQSQATAQGRSVTEYVEQFLRRYAAALIHRADPPKPFHIRTHEDAVAWILSQNPDIDNQNHTDTDWQALKSEGRRF